MEQIIMVFSNDDFLLALTYNFLLYASLGMLFLAGICFVMYCFRRIEFLLVFSQFTFYSFVLMGLIFLLFGMAFDDIDLNINHYMDESFKRFFHLIFFFLAPLVCIALLIALAFILCLGRRMILKTIAKIKKGDKNE